MFNPSPLINTNDYPPGYRPNVVLAIVTIKYYPLNNKKDIHTFIPEITSMTLDDDNLFPDITMYATTLNRLSKLLISHKSNKLFFWIDSIDVLKVLGSVSYNYNPCMN